jgi:ketosteroid isomerase-like protein
MMRSAATSLWVRRLSTKFPSQQRSSYAGLSAAIGILIKEGRTMPAFRMSRREMFGTGGMLVTGTALAGAASAPARASELSANESANETVVRKYFKSWETKDWGPFDAILADDFTFTSPNGDDHISKSAFKKRCWDTQIDFIKTFDIELLMAQNDDVLVKYLCHTKNGKSFRNIEYHRLANQKIASIECYFGGQSTFASAVGSK